MQTLVFTSLLFAYYFLFYLDTRNTADTGGRHITTMMAMLYSQLLNKLSMVLSDFIFVVCECYIMFILSKRSKYHCSELSTDREKSFIWHIFWMSRHFPPLIFLPRQQHLTARATMWAVIIIQSSPFSYTHNSNTQNMLKHRTQYLKIISRPG